MRKITAGLSCVILAVVIAVTAVGCGKQTELTYNGISQTNQPNTVGTSQGVSSPLPSQTEPSSTDNKVETVLYELTTQQGETVQVLQTTEPIAVTPTMNYDPVTVPTMPTTYINTTQPYIPPTYSGSEQPGQVTTNPATPSTTEGTTEVKLKHKSVSGTSGYISQGKIIVCVDDGASTFGNKINAKKGKATVSIDGKAYSTDYKVLSSPDVDGAIIVEVSMSGTIEEAVEISSIGATVTIPKDAIVSTDNIANSQFTTIPIK